MVLSVIKLRKIIMSAIKITSKMLTACEIYSTWPRATLEANILAIMSFTLNRVYTEWYRNKGHDFTITSSTAYDHKFIPGKTTYNSINTIVDEIFADYLSRPNVRQPILTQYCDGKKVSCPEWMTQWGSKALGDQGYSPIEILRYYYGDNMYINTAQEISGVPSSWPGYNPFQWFFRGQSSSDAGTTQCDCPVPILQFQKLLWTVSMVLRLLPLCENSNPSLDSLKREQSIIAHGIKSPKFT